MVVDYSTTGTTYTVLQCLTKMQMRENPNWEENPGTIKSEGTIKTVPHRMPSRQSQLDF